MQKIIISDTSCLILLDKIGEIELLHKLFGTITTTNEVAAEFNAPLPQWIQLQQPVNKHYQLILENSIDKGEASAIALAVENPGCLLIIDELKGRRFAGNLGINITGTLGILADAKMSGYITAVKPILDKIKKTNFRLSEKLEKAILFKAGE